MRKRIIILLFVVLFAGTSFVFAGGKGVGTTGADFLKIGQGGRSNAMAGAFGGLADDVNAIYWNPAGLVQLPCWQVGAMHSIWVSGLYYDSLVFASPLKKIVLGGQFVRFDAGSTEGTDIYGNPTGKSYPASDMALGISSAFRLGQDLSVGMNLKNIRRKLGEEKDSTVGFDFGFLLRKPKKISLGFVLQNLGGRIYDAKLPFNFKIASLFWLGPLGIDFDCNIPTDNKANVALGTEYWIKDMLALRAGYTSASGIGLACGVGMRIKDIQVDYAFQPYGDLGNVHFLSMVYNFGKVSSEEAALRRRLPEAKVTAPKPKKRKRVARARKERKPRAVREARKPRKAKRAKKPKKKIVIPEIKGAERQALLVEFAGKAKKMRLPVEEKENAIVITLPTNFEFGNPTLQSKDKRKFGSLAKLLKKYPALKIRVQTHIAGKGSAQFKLDLTAQQAENIKAFLVSKGLPEQQISCVGYGETQPIAEVMTPEGIAKNCRVEFVIY